MAPSQRKPERELIKQKKPARDDTKRLKPVKESELSQEATAVDIDNDVNDAEKPEE